MKPCAILSTRSGGAAGRTSSRAVSGEPMTEILTESFCERCGTRYTFESAAPEAAAQGREGGVARAEELRPVRRHLDGRGDGRGAERDRARGHHLPARRLPQDLQLLHAVPAVHLPELLERSRGALPDLRAPPRSRGPSGAVPRPARERGRCSRTIRAAGRCSWTGRTASNGTNGTQRVPSPAEQVELEPPDADFDVAARLDALTMIAAPAGAPAPVAEPQTSSLWSPQCRSCRPSSLRNRNVAEPERRRRRARSRRTEPSLPSPKSPPSPSPSRRRGRRCRARSRRRRRARRRRVAEPEVAIVAEPEVADAASNRRPSSRAEPERR